MNITKIQRSNTVEITSSQVKELREKTGVGMMDCKVALKECNGDMEQAIDYLRKKGIATAQKRGGRAAKEGQVCSYIHTGGKIGVLVEVNCETDFSAKTADFSEFIKNVAMHIAASNPLVVDRKDITPELIAREKDIYMTQAKETGKPANVLEKIVEGKMQKFYADVSLMEQQYVKNPDIKIQDLMNELIAKTGEKVVISRFVRYQLGESSNE
jgi:elongation factor Ts